MPNPDTIVELLAAGADRAEAIAAPGRPALTYSALRRQVANTAAALNRLGIGRNDRVAMVLPNGPEMASAFLAVAACATTAPLNPAYLANEFSFYLQDLAAKALLVERGSTSPAVEVAAGLGLAILELVPDPAGPAGLFEIAPRGGGGVSPWPIRQDRLAWSGDQPGQATPSTPPAINEDTVASIGSTPTARADPGASPAEGRPAAHSGDASTGSEPAGDGFAEPGDVALILHTSGTTSRPKIVPLTQANICASAYNIRDTLALTPADRCLNVMPLFHIHGLMAAVLASLAAGACVCCTPGFDALRFFAWLAEARPTWYTAVPTMHQAILGRAERNRAAIAAAPLRFARSSSASLPPQVLAQLEETFRAPVIEAYGMTEASHQMTSNPLPPRPHKPGTVGVPFGLEVAIMDDAGQLLPAGSTGEIVIRGPNVIRGYENNPQANASSFTDGWFRTGDQGVQDEDGYLAIKGRLKEIINRGGEKVSPREVDEVLLDHPAVLQAVTFAMPHPKLGEEVAAAVVLRPGAEAGERELQAFAAERLAPFKVPRKILIVDEIPKGPTGKLQRIGLAEKLGVG